MKKRALAGVLALVILAGAVTLAGASGQSQALVSLSYLTGTFWDDLKATVKQDVDRNTTDIYNNAAAQAGGGAGSFTARTGTSGDVLTGSAGSGLIWTSGSGVVRSGELIDVTVGSEVAVGGALSVGHRYLTGTGAILVVMSGDARWMAEGNWTMTAGEPLPVVLPFTDVTQDAWYYSDVSYVYQRGLFNGDTPTSFAPEEKMQRCMMTTVLYRLAGKPAVSYIALFRDIPDGEWYTDGTVWAGRHEVVNGVEPGRFNPFSNVTRQEIAVILHRYALKMGYDVSVSAGLSGFRDASLVADWGREAISWAVGAGILNGSNGALIPDGAATRAEVAAMLHRFTAWAERQ